MSRSGTEKRKRTVQKTYRFTPEEAAELARRADLAALTEAAYVRLQCLDSPPPRQARRPTVDHEAVGRLLGQLGKVGSNLNQLARAANTGQFETAGIDAALRDLSELRSACLLALGRQP